jgi:hypothetical protein
MPGPPRRPGNPVSDIERFLMEVERLRRKTAEEKRQTENEDVDEVEVVRAAPPPPPPPPRRQPQRPRSRRKEPQQVLEVIPAPAPPPAPAASAPSAYDQPAQKAPATAKVSRAAEVEAAGQGVLPPTQLSLDVVSLLRSKQVRTAFVLSEILGPPLALRRRRR